MDAYLAQNLAAVRANINVLGSFRSEFDAGYAATLVTAVKGLKMLPKSALYAYMAEYEREYERVAANMTNGLDIARTMKCEDMRAKAVRLALDLKA